MHTLLNHPEVSDVRLQGPECSRYLSAIAFRPLMDSLIGMGTVPEGGFLNHRIWNLKPETVRM
jgi:hypothetical protein